MTTKLASANYKPRQHVARSFASKETVTITYVDPTGDEFPVEAEVGKHLLDVAHDNDIELEGRCHMIIDTVVIVSAYHVP